MSFPGVQSGAIVKASWIFCRNWLRIAIVRVCAGVQDGTDIGSGREVFRECNALLSRCAAVSDTFSVCWESNVLV